MDTSDWMRNGDYLPTRLSAQEDAVQTLLRTKLDSDMGAHRESTVGLVAYGNKR